MALLRAAGKSVHLFRLAAVLTSVLCAAGPAADGDEYRVKAAFLYNFAKFVVWRQQDFAGSSAPLAICVLGENPFGDALDQTVSGKMVDGRALVVRHLSAAAPVSNCQILFFSSSERKHVRSILAEIGASGVLTVGETAGFSAEGGVVNFKLEDGKVRFEINVGAAEQQGLHISSKLLSLAEIVKSEGREKK